MIVWILYKDVDLELSDLSFSCQNVFGFGCYKQVRGYKHLWALRNPIEENLV